MYDVQRNLFDEFAQFQSELSGLAGIVQNDVCEFMPTDTEIDNWEASFNRFLDNLQGLRVRVLNFIHMARDEDENLDGPTAL